VQVDQGAHDAVASLSRVVVDLSGSAGSGTLSYAVDFGDGTKVAGRTASHVFSEAGTFTVTGVVLDAQGRAASATQQVVVKTLSGRWVHAGYDSAARGVKVRQIDVAQQDGLAIQGRYRVADVRDWHFTGTLIPPRTVRIVADSGVSFEGDIPDTLGAAGDPWTLRMRDDSSEGRLLDFRPIIGEASVPPPHAALRLTLDSFGDTIGLAYLSPIEFDGSGSAGSGLSYFIEFGDNSVATEARTTHRIDKAGRLTSRLTVVDEWGRSDSDVRSFVLLTLGEQQLDGWLSSPAPGKSLRLTFLRRTGLTWEGTVRYRLDQAEGTAGFSALLSGERDVRIVVPDLGATLSGYVESPTSASVQMVLTQSGGDDSGTVWRLGYDDGPG
jgi:PKD repeat protein